MSLPRKLRAGPASAVLAARALRRLVTARRALRKGATTPEVLRALTRTTTAAPPSPAAAAAALRRAGMLVPGATCVPRAVVLASLLTPSDESVAVVLGAKRTGQGTWTAHAWVEVDGQPWLDGGAAAFKRLATYPALANWALLPSGDLDQSGRAL